MSDSREPGRSARRFFLFLVFCLVSPLLLVALAAPAPAVGVLWDWANAIGYVGVALVLLLFFYTGRPRAFPPFSGRFFANIHRDLGYVALLLVLVHVGLLLYTEPLLLEHLKPSAPLYMLAGLASTVLFLLLAITSITPLRRRLWPDYHRFRGFHAWLSMAAVVLLLVHIVGSGYYLNTGLKTAILLLVSGVLLGVYIDKRHVHLRHDRSVARLRNTSHYAAALAFGPVTLVLVLALGLACLWLGLAP